MRLGPYSITGPIGAGGMGEVYRAHDSRLNRDVAIKTLPAALADDSNRMARFQREAQVLASLSHPNIASIYGLEDDQGVRALVMELVEGVTLGERIAAGPIPLEEALGIARQIGEALSAAHDKGIVHRDLKPANVKLTPEGKVKVLDFGLAKALDTETASGDPVNSPTLTLDATRAGVIMGTAGYMAPEQARGKPVDKRADIWAFGVVLLEMLTGKSTFEGETVSDTLAAVLRADIEWKQLPVDTPPKVRRLLQRCLERDPKKRLRDIGDAWMELDSPDESAARAAAPVVEKKGSWLPWAAAAVIAAAGVGWGLLRSPKEPPRTPVHWIYTQKDFIGFPVVSHDGTRLALTEIDAQNPHLALRMMNQTEAKAIPGTDNLALADFSPDGQSLTAYDIANTGDVKLKKIAITGGAATTLAASIPPFGASWGDDNTVVYATDKGLTRISDSGGSAQQLTQIDKARQELSHRTPHFLPGSKALTFTIVKSAENDLAVLDLKSGKYRTVVNNATDGRYVKTGHLLYLRTGTVFAVPFNAGKLAVTGNEAPVIEGVSISGPGNSFAEYSVADSGLVVYMEGAANAGGATTLGWMDLMGSVQPVSDAQLWGTGRLSPDGKKVANEIYSKVAGEGNPGDIWVFELERHIKTRLTFGGENTFPIWTPDGKRIIYGGTANGKSGVYSVMADGSGRPELLFATDGPVRPSSWSPDGKWLLYSIGSPARIYMAPFNGATPGKPVPLHETSASENDGQVSPDGRWVAYASKETGDFEIYVHPFPGPGGRERVSTQGGDAVRWARSGKQLFYSIRSGAGALMAVDFQSTPQLHISLPQALAKTPFGTTWDPAPDGKHLLIEMIGEGSATGRRLDGITDWFEELRKKAPSR